MSRLSFRCASWSSSKDSCKKDGKYSCKNCLVVNYCGPECQKVHWPEHKLECLSPLSKKNWQPSWVIENRTPAFIGNGLPEAYGEKKHLWGNIPAFDILQLGSNEGPQFKKGPHILFAASGDARNLIKTVSELTSSYCPPLNITINDRDFDVVARNIILLIIAFVGEDIDETVDAIIHLWYSAFVRKSDTNLLLHRVLPFIEEVCQKIKDKPSGCVLGKTWRFGQHSFRVALKKSSWDRLSSLIKGTASLTTRRAHESRTAVTLAKTRVDYRDRYLCCQSPLHRIPFNKFWKDGLLLPFGFPRDGFHIPNPLLFNDTKKWPMQDSATPLGGWPLGEVINTPSGPANADIYGKLFYYLRDTFKKFLNRLPGLNLSLTFFQVDILALPSHLQKNTFSRIEVSNLADLSWLGVHRTLGLMLPLLQSPVQNPHATLITLFMNAVEIGLLENNMSDFLLSHRAISERLYKYFPTNQLPSSRYDPLVIRGLVAGELVQTYDHVFNRYSKNFVQIASSLGAAMKEENSVIEKWPYRLKLQPGQPGAQEEFERCLSATTSGKECYIEWKRTR